MTTPYPPAFSIVHALSGWRARRPSNAPAAALWIYNPTIAPMSLDEREYLIDQFVEFLVRGLIPSDVARLRAETAGQPPSAALRWIGDHLNERFPPGTVAPPRPSRIWTPKGR